MVFEGKINGDVNQSTNRLTGWIQSNLPWKMEWQSFAIEVKFKPRLGVMSSQAFIFRIISSSQKWHQRAHEVTAYCCSWDPMGAEDSRWLDRRQWHAIRLESQEDSDIPVLQTTGNGDLSHQRQTSWSPVSLLLSWGFYGPSDVLLLS